MKLHQALATGLPFRRKEWGMWRSPTEGFDVNDDDVTEDDWEVLEPTVTISRTQFWNSYKETLEEASPTRAYYSGGHIDDTITELAAKLGFGGQGPTTGDAGASRGDQK